MKALMKCKPAPGLDLVDVDIPKISPDEILIKIKKTAICGTDMHIYSWDEWSQVNVPVPLVTGHEYVGEIAEVGANVQGFAVGERVSGEGHLTCGFCRNCRAGRQHLCRNTRGIGVNVQGAFAEYLALPARNAFKVPSSIEDNIAAIFDPLGNAVHTALAFDLVGEDVLITGAGPIGIMAIAIAKFAGARHIVVTDINDDRLLLAKAFSPSALVNPKKQELTTVMKELNIVEGFDVCLEMSGSGSAMSTTIDVINHGGKIALLGILPSNYGVDWSKIIFKGLQIKGIYGREMYETWYKMKSMLEAGLDIKSIITHEFPIDEYQAGFELMSSGKSGKVILNW